MVFCVKDSSGNNYKDLRKIYKFCGLLVSRKENICISLVLVGILGTLLPPTPSWSRFDLFIDVYSIFYFIYCISSYTLYFVYFFTCHFFLESKVVICLCSAYAYAVFMLMPCLCLCSVFPAWCVLVWSFLSLGL